MNSRTGEDWLLGAGTSQNPRPVDRCFVPVDSLFTLRDLGNNPNIVRLNAREMVRFFIGLLHFSIHLTGTAWHDCEQLNVM